MFSLKIGILTLNIDLLASKSGNLKLNSLSNLQPKAAYSESSLLILQLLNLCTK